MLLIMPTTFYLFHPRSWSEWLISLTSMIGLLVCVLLHEISHTVVAQRLGIPVKQIMIWPLGGFAQLSRIPEKPSHKFIISAAGPLMSFLLALLLGCLWAASWFSLSLWNGLGSFWTSLIYRPILFLAITNGVLVVFNLLPIYSLDGGTMLNALMEMLFSKRVADNISIVIGIPFLLGLIIFGLRTRDYLLLGFCVLLALGIGTLDPRSRRLILLGINYLFQRTGFHHLNEDFDNAIRGHTIALQKNPKDISHLVGRALAYLNLDEHDLSLVDLDTVLQLDPQHVLALEIRGELHSFKKEYDLAMECFNRVKALKPDWAFPYFDLGGIYLEKKDYEQALTEFNRAIALEAQSPLFFLVRSMTYFRMQNLEAAHRDQAEAIRLSPQRALTMSDVNLNVYKGYLVWAQDYYGWVLAKYPKQWMAYQGRADAFVINHQLESAITDYDRAVKLAPKEAILYFRRGMAQTKLGNSNQAETDFQRVIVLTRKSHLQRRAKQLLAENSSLQPLPE